VKPGLTQREGLLVGVFLIASAVQGIAAQRVLQHTAKVEEENRKLREFGIHLIGMLETNDIVPTDFDMIVFEYFRSEGTIRKKREDES
jgi:F0F1-type ATP synthase membrane subunit c/vacuolar-type H+-ATPase subunit K